MMEKGWGSESNEKGMDGEMGGLHQVYSCSDGEGTRVSSQESGSCLIEKHNALPTPTTYVIRSQGFTTSDRRRP